MGLALRAPILVVLLACAAAGACSSADSAAFGGSAGDRGDAGASPGTSGSGGSDSAAPTGSPAASGVVLVHAAAFPSFRLCFSNLPGLQPQPDATVMPEANVVGVEVGSVVRIDALQAPGEVFVIDERVQGVQSGAGTSGKTCGELICAGGSSCLRKDRDYSSAGRVDRPLGKNQVEVMGITGCGNAFFLGDVGVAKADCPTPYDDVAGNLAVKTVPLRPVAAATKTSIPAEVVHMSFLLENAHVAGTSLDVGFGKLSGGGAMTSVAHNPALFQAGADTTLAVSQADAAVYAQEGFRVSIAPSGGGAPSFSIDLSLADVQALSSPRDVPSDYYRVASNYALLLLGDPRIKPKLGDGGPDPSYDPRRGVHLLAVPVLDPAQLDAGPEASTGDR